MYDDKWQACWALGYSASPHKSSVTKLGCFVLGPDPIIKFTEISVTMESDSVHHPHIGNMKV